MTFHWYRCQQRTGWPFSVGMTVFLLVGAPFILMYGIRGFFWIVQQLGQLIGLCTGFGS